MILDTSSLKAWRKSKPIANDVAKAVAKLFEGVPEQWHRAMRSMNLGAVQSGWWGDICDALDKVGAFTKKHGDALHWNLSDDEICQLAKRCAAHAMEIDSGLQGQGSDVESRIDAALLVVRMAGVEPPASLFGEGVILRVQDDRWWRRVLRVHVARVVEAGAVKLGVVNKSAGGYASNAALKRRSDQRARNDAALKKSIYRNEAGQVWSLAELSALSVANPVIRGGELMTRIRGAEEYAEDAGHIGIFCTMTAPSSMHAVTVGSGGRARPNPRYDGESTPRDAQAWLRKMWSRVRADAARRGILMYGVRVAEPHHDATPHWHALLWVQSERHYLELKAIIWYHWVSEFGHEPGAEQNRCNFKRMKGGGAAGYVAKYISKSIGHHALAEHLDMSQGELFEVQTGYVEGWRRVDAWAATWGIRQFQAIGMPGVGIWRALRRVSKDQADHCRVTGDGATYKAWFASHKHGDGIAANFCAFVKAVGGMCVPKHKLHLRIEKRDGEKVNGYGETVQDRTIYGLKTRAGKWLVSRRMAWAAVSAQDAPAMAQDAKEREPTAHAWTSFNNCTARLTNELITQVFGLRVAVDMGGKWGFRC